MKNSIEITTHRLPQYVYIEASPMNDGIYLIYEYDNPDPQYRSLRYLGYSNVRELVPFLSTL